MIADDMGVIVVFAGANVRYLTGSYQGNWKYNINIRYAVLPRDGEPYSLKPRVQTCTTRGLIYPDERPYSSCHDLAMG